jgi:DNA-binding response OmpR family regulator
MPTVFVIESGKVGRTPTLLEAVQEAGFHALPMSDGQMALAVLHAIRADLLVVDVADTRAGGPELIEQVRRNEMLRQMPILAVGVPPDDQEGFRRLTRSVGTGGVLAAGAYSEEELIDQVRKYLNRAASPLSAETAFGWTAN